MFGLLESGYGVSCHNPIVNVAIVNKRYNDHLTEMMDESQLRSIWGVLGVLESPYGCRSSSLSSNGAHSSELILDSPRELDRRGSFREEAPRFQLVSDSASGNPAERSLRSLVQENMLNEDTEDKHSIVRRRQRHIPRSEHVDHMAKTHSTEWNIFKKSVQPSSSCHQNYAAGLSHHKPSNSDKMSFDKLTDSEIFGPICTHTSEMRHEHAFTDRRFNGKRGTRSTFKPFSHALEVLSTNKELSTEFLPEPNQLLQRFSKSTVDAKYSDYESRYASSSEDSSVRKPFLGKTNRKCQHFSTSSFRSLPDKIVVLKPAPQNIKDPGNVSCHCSSMQSYKKLDGKVTNSKPASLSFREMTRKLKHTFVGSRKESSKSSLGSMKGGDCICGGVEIKNSFSSTTNAALSKKASLKFLYEPDNAHMNAAVRKKLDFPSVGLSKKQEFDVICEAKRYLSAGAVNDDVLEHTRSNLSRRTVAQILASPDHDLWSINLRKDSLCCYNNGLVRICNDRNSLNITESDLLEHKGKRISSNTLVPNEDYIFTDHKINDEPVEGSETGKKVSVVRSAHDQASSATDYVNYDGESMTEEMDSIQNEVCTSEVENEITSPEQRTDIIESRKDDESVIHYVDSLSENDALSSTLDDNLSTPSTSCQLDMADSSKFQEHRSPISVLEPFFTDDTNSSPSFKFQTAQRLLQPLRLDFEECSLDSTSQNQRINANPCLTSQDHISLYVHSVLQSCLLNWCHLSEINPPPKELLDASLFNEVEFPRINPHLNPQLLFNHMDEILLEIHRRHFSSCACRAVIKPKMMTVKLEDIVLEEIMKQADFYLLPKTEKTTLNQIVSKDVAKSGSWLDIREDTEQIAAQVSEDVLEETIWEILVESQTLNIHLLQQKVEFFI